MNQTLPYQHQTFNRRLFLQKTALASFAAVLSACSQLRRRTATQKVLHMALLSDTHIPADRTNTYRNFKPWQNLERTVPEIVAAAPEGIVICGDAARLEGKTEDYKELQLLLEPLRKSMAFHIGLGNHDDRANFLAVFNNLTANRAPVQSRYITVLEHQAVRIVVLDSLLYPNKTPGHLGREQRNWLASFLTAANDRPVVLFLHHTLGDGDGDLLDADRLVSIVRRHRHVKAIFYGHSHEWKITRDHGVALINIPALGYNFKDSEPVGWVEARFQSNGVNLELHPLTGTTQWQKQTRFVPWT
ncbi:MAG TPA: metallophosphoesterase [Verrucomicrobiota bacterium]|nr:metallophosphoesterase [Verrucomicrobiota bacterium]